MSSYHTLAKRAYPNAQPYNPYQQASPTPTMGAAEWATAPGIKASAPAAGRGIGEQLWRNKSQIAGSLGGWSAGAAAGTAVGTMLAPFTFGASVPLGAGIGSIAGGLIGSYGGEKIGEQADNYLNERTDKANPEPYRPPPVTGLASYGANMIHQGIQENRDRAK